MPDALRQINLRDTPQSAPADPRQVRNHADGFTCAVTPQARLRRFLVLGTDGGTYDTAERTLTVDNAAVVVGWAQHRCAELVDEVVSISTAGRVPRTQPALFALAAAASLGDAEGRRAALSALPRVARTGTHLFMFAGYVQQFRGWGRGLRRAVADWYLSRPVADVAFQAVKYRQRQGWTHRDLLRLAHPATDEPERRQLFDWICGRRDDGPGVIESFRRAQAAVTVAEWAAIPTDYPQLSWEMLPDAALAEPAVWAALIGNGLPQTALLRQLPRLTGLGLLQPTSSTLSIVTEQLTDAERLRRTRVHPVSVRLDDGPDLGPSAVLPGSVGCARPGDCGDRTENRHRGFHCRPRPGAAAGSPRWQSRHGSGATMRSTRVRPAFRRHRLCPCCGPGTTTSRWTRS